jgi:hypothetical protein
MNDTPLWMDRRTDGPTDRYGTDAARGTATRGRVPGRTRRSARPDRRYHDRMSIARLLLTGPR